MICDNPYDEPTLTLVSGDTIRVAAHSLLHDLLATGHTVSVDVVGSVRVEPADLHEDVVYALGVLEDEIAALLGSRLRVH